MIKLFSAVQIALSLTFLCTSAYGQVQSAIQQNGKCIDDLGWSTGFTDPGMWACNGDQNQQFTLVQDSQGFYSISNNYSGLCLDITGWSTVVGASLEQYTCNSNDNQKFTAVAGQSGTYQLKSKFNGLCIDISGSNSSLIQNTCSSSASQIFAISGLAQTPPPITPNPVANLAPLFSSTIKSVSSSQCIDDLGYSKVASAPGTYGCDGGTNQVFTFSSTGSGAYTVQNDYSQLCLQAGSSASILFQEACGLNSALQNFQILSVSSTIFQLKANGLCLDLLYSSSTGQTNLTMNACSISPTQQFVISAPAAQSVSLSTPPSGATVVSSIENLSGWQPCNGACSACPASNPNCLSSASNMAPDIQHINGDGIFQVYSGPAYATSLWGHSLASETGETHFLWAFDFMSNTAAIENQEFDLYAVINGRQYMFGTQCNHDNGNWQGWNNATQKWLNSTVPCPVAVANQWHHIVMDLSLNTSTQSYTYNAIQIDGYTYATGLSGEPSASTNWASVMGVQVQVDQDSLGSPVQEHIRNMNVTMW